MIGPSSYGTRLLVAARLPVRVASANARTPSAFLHPRRSTTDARQAALAVRRLSEWDAHMTSEEQSSAEREQLGDAVAAEQRLLDGAPSVAEDGARIQRDSDAGPTAETLSTASQILDAQGLGARLHNLQEDTDKSPT